MRKVSLAPGSRFRFKEEDVVVIKPIDVDTVLVRRVPDGSTVAAAIRDLSNEDVLPAKPEPLPDDLSPEDLEKAEKVRKALEPLLGRGRVPLSEQLAVAKALRLSVPTIQRRRSAYERTGSLLSLIRPKPDGGKGKSRISAEGDALIDHAIKTHYLKRTRPTIKATYRQLTIAADAAKIPVPTYSTLRNRIKKLPPEIVAKGRMGSRLARQSRAPKLKHFPGANQILSVVQIDHTLMDIFLVDEETRRAIARPWLTLAIDVYSRKVTGFYISLDPVGTLSVGMCIYRSIIDKSKWLEELDVKGSWGIRGRPGKLFMDNAREFHSKMVEEACRRLEIVPEFRPGKTPSYGGHIEAMMGTVAREIKLLVGTTKVAARKLGEYDPEKHAAMTLRDLERWFADWVVNVYHKRKHSQLGCSPDEQAHKGFFGPNGTGIPDDEGDKDMLKLSLMPMTRRTIQQYGIRFENTTWWSSQLHTYFDPTQRKQVERVVRFDPRNMKNIYVWIEETKSYITVGFANLSMPDVSLWELRRAIRDEQDDDDRRRLTDSQVVEAVKRLREREEQSIAETKSVRRSKKPRLDRTRRNHQVANAEAHRPKLIPQSTPVTIDISLTDDVLPPIDISKIRVGND